MKKAPLLIVAALSVVSAFADVQTAPRDCSLRVTSLGNSKHQKIEDDLEQVAEDYLNENREALGYDVLARESEKDPGKAWYGARYRLHVDAFRGSSMGDIDDHSSGQGPGFDLSIELSVDSPGKSIEENKVYSDSTTKSGILLGWSSYATFQMKQVLRKMLADLPACGAEARSP